jgi:hypothetical protein
MYSREIGDERASRVVDGVSMLPPLGQMNIEHPTSNIEW